LQNILFLQTPTTAENGKDNAKTRKYEKKKMGRKKSKGVIITNVKCCRKAASSSAMILTHFDT